MAWTNQGSNFIAEQIAVAKELLALRDKMRNLVARYNNNDMANQLVSADIEAAYSGLDKAEIVAGITAFNAVLTALGDDTSGQASNLFKLVL